MLFELFVQGNNTAKSITIFKFKMEYAIQHLTVGSLLATKP